jgi:hypothetical protein
MEIRSVLMTFLDPANMLIPSPASMVGPDAQEEEDLSKMLAVLQEQFGQGVWTKMSYQIQ